MSLFALTTQGDAKQLSAFVKNKWVLRRRGLVLKWAMTFALLALVGAFIHAQDSRSSRREVMQAIQVPTTEMFPSLEKSSPLVTTLLGFVLALGVTLVVQRIYFSRLPLLWLFIEVPLALLICYLWAVTIRNGAQALGYGLATFTSGHAARVYTFETPHDFLTVIIYFFWRRHLAWKTHVESRRIDWALKTINALDDDMTGVGKLTLDVHHILLRRKKPAGYFGARKYVDPWFALQTPLADGNKLALRVTLRMVRKIKSKRKYTKINERYHTNVDVTLRCSAKRFPKIESIEELRGKSITRDLCVGDVKIENSTLRIKAATLLRSRYQNRYRKPDDIGETPTPIPHVLPLRLLSAIYAHLGPIRLPRKISTKLKKTRGKILKPKVAKEKNDPKEVSYLLS